MRKYERIGVIWKPYFEKNACKMGLGAMVKNREWGNERWGLMVKSCTSEVAMQKVVMQRGNMQEWAQYGRVLLLPLLQVSFLSLQIINMSLTSHPVHWFQASRMRFSHHSSSFFYSVIFNSRFRVVIHCPHIQSLLPSRLFLFSSLTKLSENYTLKASSLNCWQENSSLQADNHAVILPSTTQAVHQASLNLL